MHLTEWIKEQKEICAKATEGPWSGKKEYLHGPGGQFILTIDVDSDKAYEDIQFIANSRSALPQALDIIEKLSKAARKLEYEKEFFEQVVADISALRETLLMDIPFVT